MVTQDLSERMSGRFEVDPVINGPGRIDTVIINTTGNETGRIAYLFICCRNRGFRKIDLFDRSIAINNTLLWHGEPDRIENRLIGQGRSIYFWSSFAVDSHVGGDKLQLIVGTEYLYALQTEMSCRIVIIDIRSRNGA